MVGIVGEHQSRQTGAPRHKSSAPKAIKHMSLGTSKKASAPRKSSSSNDVFPLDDEDLKEF
jgi:hypothetical protein